MLSDACGVRGHDIMFSSNETPAADYVLADKLGAIINLDDITHIDFLEQTIGSIPETISCRYNPGGLFEISNGIMDNPGDAKYGMTTEQLYEAFRILKQKGAKHFGIHAFLCSNTVTNDYYPKLAEVLFKLAVDLQRETGAHISFINLSGGIGIPYEPGQEPNDIRVIGEGVCRVYEDVLVPAGMGDVALYTELGRFMLGPYGCLVTRAIHEKHTHKDYVGVDACAVNLMRPAIYGAYHHITVAGKEDAPCDHVYDVVGGLSVREQRQIRRRSCASRGRPRRPSGHPRHRRPRSFHGIQLQRQAALGRGAAARRRKRAAHSPCRDAGGLFRDARLLRRLFLSGAQARTNLDTAQREDRSLERNGYG